MQRFTKGHSLKQQTDACCFLITTQHCQLPPPSPHTPATHNYEDTYEA